MMWRAVRREFSLNRIYLVFGLLFIAGSWAVGEALGLCLMYFAQAEEYVSFSMILAVTVAIIFCVIYIIYYFSVGYEQALAMSCTRRRFLLSMLASSLLQLLAITAFLAVLALADKGVYLLLFGGLPYDGPALFSAGSVRRLWMLPAALAAIACMGLFFGACIQRWGRRALLLLWGVYMAVLLFGDTIAGLALGADRDTPLGRVLGAAMDALALLPTGAPRLALAGAALAAAAAAGAAMLLRGSVRRCA